MRIYTINSEDASNRLSILYAMNQGYKIKLDADGCAEVSKRDGNTYHIDNWRCDCPDATQRNGGSYTKGDSEEHFCKHVAFVSQLYPCPDCRATMIMRAMNPDGGIKFYSCHNCSAIKAGCAVKLERQQKASQERELSEVLRKGEEASHAVFA